MGCDIHMYREKFVGNKWITADEWVGEDYGDGETSHDVPYEKRFTDRNYNLFGVLAGVRERDIAWHLTPRGMPLQPSPEVARVSESWGADCHGHTYLYLHELRELDAYCDAVTVPISGMMRPAQWEKLQASAKSETPNWDLLYPYCQWTSEDSAVKFSIDIPASFILGDALKRIIAMFDGVDGENHRVVFWFDN